MSRFPNFRRPVCSAGLVCTLLVLSGPALSQTQAPASSSDPSPKASGQGAVSSSTSPAIPVGSAEPSAAEIELLAAGCANCHGPAGYPGEDILPLEGMPAERLRARLQAFRRGGADAGATLMPRLIQGYDDREIEALVRWFSTAQERAR